jgi:hypothetical protein
MMLSSESVDTDFGGQHRMEGYEMMYFLRRAWYEISLAVSKRPATHPPEERSLLHIRFKDQCRMPGLILEIRQMEDLVEGLSRLMRYIRAAEAMR